MAATAGKALFPAQFPATRALRFQGRIANEIRRVIAKQFKHAGILDALAAAQPDPSAEAVKRPGDAGAPGHRVLETLMAFMPRRDGEIERAVAEPVIKGEGSAGEGLALIGQRARAGIIAGAVLLVFDQTCQPVRGLAGRPLAGQLVVRLAALPFGQGGAHGIIKAARNIVGVLRGHLMSQRHAADLLLNRQCGPRQDLVAAAPVKRVIEPAVIIGVGIGAGLIADPAHSRLDPDPGAELMAGEEIGALIGVAIALAAQAGDINAVGLESTEPGGDIAILESLAETGTEAAAAKGAGLGPQRQFASGLRHGGAQGDHPANRITAPQRRLLAA